MTSPPPADQSSRLISLTYLSTATTPFDSAELTELLGTVRPRNQERGLTGMLLHSNEHFIQTLEGPQEAVDATFDRIGRDPRHRDIMVALHEPVDERKFPDWSMGFETITPEDAARLPGFNDYLDQRTLDPEQARELGRAGIFHRVFRDSMR